MLIVAVGDRAKIAPQIQPLGLGPVALSDADGKALDAESAVTK
jgi:hypothetical protein